MTTTDQGADVGANGDEPVEEVPTVVTTELERLRSIRRELRADRTLDLDVPGYHGLLVARYRLLDWHTVRNIVKRMEKNKHKEGDQAELNVQMDTIASALVELLMRRESGELVPMDEDYGPVRYDRHLMQLMDLPDTGTARESVQALFASDMAIVGHHGKLITWMQGEEEEVEEDHLGESVGPPPSRTRPEPQS